MDSYILTVLMLLLIFDMTASLVGAVMLWKIRRANRLAQCMGMLLSATVVNQAGNLVMWWVDFDASTRYLAMLLVCRLCKAVASWWLLLYLLGVVHNGKVVVGASIQETVAGKFKGVDDGH